MTGFVIAIVESPLYQKRFMPVTHSENKNTFGVRCTPYLSTILSFGVRCTPYHIFIIICIGIEPYFGLL